MMGRKRRLRLYVQLAFCVLAVGLLWPVPFWPALPQYVSGSSSLVAICGSIASRTLAAGTILGFGFAVLALWKRRWFCHYVCPTGLLLEEISRSGLKKTAWWRRCPSVGQYLALLTLIGALIGYPLFLWLDPLAIFSNAFSVRGAADFAAGLVSILILLILCLLSVTSGGIWCARLCPLGATQDLLEALRLFFHSKDIERGKGVLQFSNKAVRNRFARRTVILGAAGIGIGVWAKHVGAIRGETAPLRPPGASPESQFAGLCIRCGNCVRTCPSAIIHPDTGEAGIAGLLAPHIIYEDEYCLEDCIQCLRVCPSGALRQMDLAEKQRYIIGEALVDGSICVLVRGEKECDLCARACSFHAIRIHWDETQYIAYPLVDPNKCNGCGACEVSCPTNPLKAIRVWRRTDLLFTIVD
jgi:ferredoxin